MRYALIAAVLLVAACSSSEEPAAAPTATATASAKATSAGPTTTATASSVSASGSAVSMETDDGVLEFSYKHPAEVGAIPELVALLKADADKRRVEARKNAAEDQARAKTDSYEFHPHSLGIEWQVVTQTPRFLSLSNSFYSFSGGAHGNYGFEGLVWDRQANRRLAASDLFVSKAALKAAVLKPFCNGLDDERRKKGMDPPTPDDSAFPRCVDPVGEATIVLGSTNRRAFDRIGFLMDPYVAGSYAEGSYEVTLPVTPAILAAVKPEYRDAFARR
jgi:hypothetical protein